jgi:hypothetical protein
VSFIICADIAHGAKLATSDHKMYQQSSWTPSCPASLDDEALAIFDENEISRRGMSICWGDALLPRTGCGLAYVANHLLRCFSLRGRCRHSLQLVQWLSPAAFNLHCALHDRLNCCLQSKPAKETSLDEPSPSAGATFRI